MMLADAYLRAIVESSKAGTAERRGYAPSNRSSDPQQQSIPSDTISTSYLRSRHCRPRPRNREERELKSATVHRIGS